MINLIPSFLWSHITQYGKKKQKTNLLKTTLQKQILLFLTNLQNRKINLYRLYIPKIRKLFTFYRLLNKLKYYIPYYTPGLSPFLKTRLYALGYIKSRYKFRNKFKFIWKKNKKQTPKRKKKNVRAINTVFSKSKKIQIKMNSLPLSLNKKKYKYNKTNIQQMMLTINYSKALLLRGKNGEIQLREDSAYLDYWVKNLQRDSHYDKFENEKISYLYDKNKDNKKKKDYKKNKVVVYYDKKNKKNYYYDEKYDNNDLNENLLINQSCIRTQYYWKIMKQFYNYNSVDSNFLHLNSKKIKLQKWKISNKYLWRILFHLEQRIGENDFFFRIFKMKLSNPGQIKSLLKISKMSPFKRYSGRSHSLTTWKKNTILKKYKKPESIWFNYIYNLYEKMEKQLNEKR